MDGETGGAWRPDSIFDLGLNLIPQRGPARDLKDVNKRLRVYSLIR